MPRIQSIAALAVFILLAGCGDSDRVPDETPTRPPPDVVDDTPPGPPAREPEAKHVTELVVNDASTKANVTTAVRDSNAFAFELYRRIRSGDENLIFSPYSISSALAMTYAGARDETADQMAKTLHFTLGQQRLHAAMSRMTGELNDRGRTGDCSLVVANRLWGLTGYRFLPSFVALTEKHYGAGMALVDFARATERARQEINSWIERQTRDKIKDLLDKTDLTPDTHLVLTNAIYFKGTWSRQFEERATRDAPFTMAAGTTVTSRMMSQTSTFGYSESRGVQILEMPYKGRALSMVVVLPKTAGGLAALERSLGESRVASWISGLRKRKVKVFIPRFTVTKRVDLARSLAAMGMPDAFDRHRADFSGMDGKIWLYITKVIHKAYVEVNEEGTEAAAATAVVMAPRGLAPRENIPVFRADHPFLFLIRDIASGAILFIGRVADPTA